MNNNYDWFSILIVLLVFMSNSFGVSFLLAMMWMVATIVYNKNGGR